LSADASRLHCAQCRLLGNRRLDIREIEFSTIMQLFGIGAEIGLAVSILKCARDIAWGAPILHLAVL
jgi:hypothetical protein